MSSKVRKKRAFDLPQGAGEKASGARQKLTRREWLVEVGETAALLGFSGQAAGKAELLDAKQTAGSGDVLPPGLYQPSLDLLTDSLESDEQYRTAPSGTETDYVPRPQGAFVPKFFSKEEFQAVKNLVRVMLTAGTPDQVDADGARFEEASEEISEWIDLVLFRAPGVQQSAREISGQHRELAVHFYGAEAVRRLETEDPQADWKDGLKWLDSKSSRRYGKPLSDLHDTQMAALLEIIGKERKGETRSESGVRFFRRLKATVIEGYYTSKQGLGELGSSGHSFHAESPGCPKPKAGS